MSFAAGDQVIENIERLLQRLWKEILSVEVSAPFPRMTYHDAMAKYGSDKPDLRLRMEVGQNNPHGNSYSLLQLHDIGELLPADLISKIGPHVNPAVDIMKLHISEDPVKTRKFVFDFMESPEAVPFLENPDGQPGVFIYDPRQPLGGLQPFGFQTAEYVEDVLNLEDGDLMVLQARGKGPFSGGFTTAGRLRLALHKAAVAQGYISPPEGFKFLWVTDFPLFSPSNETEPGQGGFSGLSSTHHPFTAPKSAQDVDLLATHPEQVHAEHYDIVVNGVELGGGSRRIHDAQVQEYVLRDVLKMSEERLQDFRHLLDVLRAGCPPHAGIALGFDRLIAVMLGRESIKDVIAFPKNARGEDLLVKTPNIMTTRQLATYHLRLVD
jgi:aspartyl-tRNA synthetase